MNAHSRCSWNSLLSTWQPDMTLGGYRISDCISSLQSISGTSTSLQSRYLTHQDDKDIQGRRETCVRLQTLCERVKMTTNGTTSCWREETGKVKKGKQKGTNKKPNSRLFFFFSAKCFGRLDLSLMIPDWVRFYSSLVGFPVRDIHCESTPRRVKWCEGKNLFCTISSYRLLHGLYRRSLMNQFREHEKTFVWKVRIWRTAAPYLTIRSYLK